MTHIIVTSGYMFNLKINMIDNTLVIIMTNGSVWIKESLFPFRNMFRSQSLI